MLGHDVGYLMGRTASYFPYAPSPMPIQSNINYQQGAWVGCLSVQMHPAAMHWMPACRWVPACPVLSPCGQQAAAHIKLAHRCSPGALPACLPCRAVGNAMYTLANSTLECLDSTEPSSSSSSTVAIAVGTAVGVLVLCGAAVGVYAWRRKRRRRVTVDAEKGGSGCNEGSHEAPCSLDAPCSKTAGGEVLDPKDSASAMEVAGAAGGGTILPPPASHASSAGNASAGSTGRPANGSHGSVDVHYSALMRSRWNGALDGVVLGELLGRWAACNGGLVACA